MGTQWWFQILHTDSARPDTFAFLLAGQETALQEGWGARMAGKRPMWALPWYFVRGVGVGEAPRGSSASSPEVTPSKNLNLPARDPGAGLREGLGKRSACLRVLVVPSHVLHSTGWEVQSPAFFPPHCRVRANWPPKTPNGPDHRGEKTFPSTALWGRPSFLCRALKTWIYLLCDFLFQLCPGASL